MATRKVIRRVTFTRKPGQAWQQQGRPAPVVEAPVQKRSVVLQNDIGEHLSALQQFIQNAREKVTRRLR